VILCIKDLEERDCVMNNRNNIWNKEDFKMSTLRNKIKTVGIIRHIGECLQWSWQRIVRGYAECDKWDM